MKIQFSTNRVGVPHLIKVSYFPLWKVDGADGVYPVSPHFMLVIPRQNEITLYYKRSIWEIVGIAVFAGWVICLLAGRFAGRMAYTGCYPAFQNMSATWNRLWGPVEGVAVKMRLWLLLLAALTILVGTISGVVLRNRPTRIYFTGHQAYEQGIQNLARGKSEAAQTRFKKAINIFELLLDRRADFDHVDVIHSLLFTATCYEKLGDEASAIKWYRTLITEYAYSRYYAEGSVKLARAYQRRAIKQLTDGTAKWRGGLIMAGSRLMDQGNLDMQIGFGYYQQAFQKDPYSIWNRYARTDLNHLLDLFKHLRVEAGAVNDTQIEETIALLEQKARSLLAF